MRTDALLEKAPVQATTKAIGTIVRLARHNKKLTQAQLAELAGLSQPTICEIEKNGKSQDIENLTKIASALEMPLSRLILAAEKMEGTKGALRGILAAAATVADVLDPQEIEALFKEAAGP